VRRLRLGEGGLAVLDRTGLFRDAKRAPERDRRHRDAAAGEGALGYVAGEASARSAKASADGSPGFDQGLEERVEDR
jgi:hypothetical protein